MPTYSSAQRTAISQFLSFTQAKESVAGRHLKNNDWNVERALNSFYQSAPNDAAIPTQQNVKKLFDKYKDGTNAEPDKIGMEGTMQYLGDLNLELDEVAVIALFDLLQAPAMGEFERDSFVSGWRNASSSSNPCDTLSRQSSYIDTLRQKLQSDPVYFKQVYRSAFKYAKPGGQRAVPVDDAIAFWDMFFRKGKGGVEWNTTNTNWLDLWNEFYKEKSKRPVNKDLWNMVGELVAKTKEPGGESLSWWTEDGAWPTAIDDFVALVKNKRDGTSMDTS